MRRIRSVVMPPPAWPAWLALLFMVAVLACSDDRPEPADAPGVPGIAPQTDATVDIDSQPLVPAGNLPERPPTRQDTITRGDTRDVLTGSLVRSPRSFAVPFSTYVPEGVEVELDSASGIHRVTFTSSGVPERSAFMTVRIYPAGTTRLQVEEDLHGLVSGLAPGMDETAPVEAPSWAISAQRISYLASVDTQRAGSVTVAQYGPRFFSVLMLYPALRADRLLSLFDYILDGWRWDDTGRMLTG
ncbi:MAG TPA: hypothetical protein VK912_04095 [Longimicrobiales bacterium]|nr:hypothetical protein [Longimicrobiales bacterium]